MKIAAIIAEYNPLHNGHVYLSEAVRRQTGADYIIALMSGDYVQRGTPAIADRYIRTRMALLSGIDLVLAYPTRFASSSAESFAENAVRLLNSLGCVDFLAFGSECGNLTALQKAADSLIHETPESRRCLKEALKGGLPYPAARLAAYPGLKDLLSFPNNILAIEYLKALRRTGSFIRPLTLSRLGSGYHDNTYRGTLSSASALRLLLSETPSGERHSLLSQAMTPDALSLLEEYLSIYPPMTEDDLSLILGEKLWQFNDSDELTDILSVNQDLANRIFRKRKDFQSFSQFAEILKTRTFTRTRINRALLHLALDLKKRCLTEDDMYAHVLGFRKNQSLPGYLKASSAIPVIANPARDLEKLSESRNILFREELRVSALYELLLSQKSQCPIRSELTRPLIVV